MTLSGYFTLNSVFAPVLLASETENFENNCVKKNKDTSTLSAAQSSAGTAISGDITFMRMVARIL